MKQFVVIGLGRFGSSVARTLAEKGCDVLAIDNDPEKVQAISADVTHAVEADASDEEALKTIGVNNFDIGIVSIGDNVSANILCTLILKDLNLDYVIVKAPAKLHGKVLSKVGADRIVYPERDMANRIAQNLISANVLDYIEFAPEYGVIELLANNKMAGKTLEELAFRSGFDVNVMAVKKEEELYISPGADDKIEAGDKLILMGKNENLSQMRDFGS